jgi:hypothetical protein
VSGLAVRDRLASGRSVVRSVLRLRAGRAAASSLFLSRSQDRGPVTELGRRCPPSPARVRAPGPRSEPVLSPAEPSSVRRGASRRKPRVLGPVPRVPAPNERPGARLVPSAEGRPDVRRAPSPNDRSATGRAPSRAGGRAARRAPSGAGGRAARRAPSAAGERDVRRASSPPRAVVSPRARSGDDVRVVRRGPSPAGDRGPLRAPSPVTPSRPARGSCPLRPAAVRPRP